MTLAVAAAVIAVAIPASPASASNDGGGGGTGNTVVPGVGVYGDVVIGQTAKTQTFPLLWPVCGGDPYSYTFRVDWNINVTSTGVTVRGFQITTTNWGPLAFAYVAKVLVGSNQTYYVQTGIEVLSDVVDGASDSRYYVLNRTFNWNNAPASDIYMDLTVQSKCPTDNPLANVENRVIVFELDRAKYWVDTFASAPGYPSPTSTAQTGTLNSGTSYVYCKAWGRQIGSGNVYNRYWMQTDLDSGSPWRNQYVSAYYLSRWGNDEARDNNGLDIPTC